MSEESREQAQQSKSVRLGPEHTSIPNRAIDFIMPRLSSAEQSCLLYILRRTHGFSAPSVKGERKRWDRIALSQFIEGSRSDNYVFDLGTGLSRPTVIDALSQLEQREIIWVSYECPTVISKSGQARGCGWSEADDAVGLTPVIEEGKRGAKCPRCSRTLSKLYALRTLTPGFIRRFLSETDGKEWGYDPETRHYYLVDPDAQGADKAVDQLPDPEQLRQQLWFPDLVDEIIAHANSRLKSGRMAPTRLVSQFLEPVLAMQEQYGRNATRHALQVTARKEILLQPRARNWINFAKAVAENELHRKHGSLAAGKQEIAVESIEEQLARCAELNAAGEGSAAQRHLQELLDANLDEAAATLGGDRALARRHILEAFKRGIDDWQSVRDYTLPIDHLPSWTWEDDERNVAASASYVEADR